MALTKATSIMTTQATNIAELKTYGASMSDGDSLEILGYTTAGDGGGGNFYWDASSTDTDNGGTIIQATGITTGRWLRVFSNSIDVKWFGAVSYNGIRVAQPDASTAINAAVQACPDGGTIDLGGKYYLTAQIDLNRRNITIANGVLECEQAYTGAMLSVKPTPPRDYDIVSLTVDNIRIQTVTRELPSGSSWDGDFIGIQIQAGERAIFNCTFRSITVSYPRAGISWSHNTLTPSAVNGWTTSCTFSSLHLLGCKTVIEAINDPGNDIYSGQIFGNVFSDCTFSPRGTGHIAMLDFQGGGEFDFNNCTFFCDSTTAVTLALFASTGQRLNIDGGYWEIQPSEFADHRIQTNNVRIVAPNRYPATPGSTTTLPDFYSVNPSQNFILRDVGDWSITTSGVITKNVDYYSGNDVHKFEVGATNGTVGYTARAVDVFSYSGYGVFSVFLKTNAKPFSVYVRITYTDTTFEIFTSQQSPDTLFFEPVAIPFVTHATKVVDYIGCTIQGPNGEIAYACGPKLSTGRAISIMPIRFDNPNLIKSRHGNLGPLVLTGNGTPEAAETAVVGSTFHRLDGGAGTSFYVKETGTGNTGWVAK